MNLKPSSTLKPPINADEDINLLDVAKIFWNGRITILKYVLITGLVGVFIALLSPKEYVASLSMIPQTSQSGNNSGSLSSLASLAGLNLDMSNPGETLTPQVYPWIVTSVPFQLELMNVPFSFSDVNHPVSLYEYYTKIARPGVLSLIRQYTVGLPGLISSTVKEDPIKKNPTDDKAIMCLSAEQEGVRGIIESQVSLTLDPRQGFLTLKSTFHQALLSAQVADKARELLQKYITRFKIEKAKDQFLFIEERYHEKKKEYVKAQELLARFRDQNKDVSSALVRAEEERLQSEYSIAMNVFIELAKQLEQSKIKVKEETPVFLVLEPVMIPREKSKPKRGKIVIIALFLGGFLGTAMIFAQKILINLRKQWNESKDKKVIIKSD